MGRMPSFLSLACPARSSRARGCSTNSTPRSARAFIFCRRLVELSIRRWRRRGWRRRSPCGCADYLHVARGAELDLEDRSSPSPRRPSAAIISIESMPMVKLVFFASPADRPKYRYSGSPEILPTRSWSAISMAQRAAGFSGKRFLEHRASCPLSRTGPTAGSSAIFASASFVPVRGLLEITALRRLADARLRLRAR